MSFIGSQPSPPANYASEVFLPQDINNNAIELQYVPLENSELVVQSGQVLTQGSNFDYTIANKTITINTNIETNFGHILVKYCYL